MEYQRLGKTTLVVSRIGIGGIPIQNVSLNDVKQILLIASESGINFIDTARGYTVSEQLIGEAMESMGLRDKFYIATKSMARTYLEMKEEIEKSLKNLRTDHIDLYQLHNITTMADYEVVLSSNGALAALLDAKEAGKILHIGLTSHSVDFLNSIIEDYPFESIQFPYNIVEKQAEQLFIKAKNKDIGIIAMKPLAGGAITNATIALKYILNNDNITVAIPGIRLVEELLENVKVEKGDYTAEEENYITDIVKQLGNDFCRRCGYCMPCTVGINIPSCFLFSGYFTRYDLKDWAVKRYNGLAVKADQCIECGECMKRCPYELNIIEKLKQVAKTFKNES